MENSILTLPLVRGDILAIDVASPDVVVYFETASALLVEVGGGTSHAAILSREFGIPCYVNLIGLVPAVKSFVTPYAELPARLDQLHIFEGP